MIEKQGKEKSNAWSRRTETHAVERRKKVRDSFVMGMDEL